MISKRLDAVGPIVFFVRGIPRPGGSKRAFIIRTKEGVVRPVITEDNKKSKDWRTSVEWEAKAKLGKPLTGPLEVRFTFYVSRPKGHFGSGKNAGTVKGSAPQYPAVKPDVTKLVRSTEDALKGIAWIDDSQIVAQSASKVYSGTPGCEISIWWLANGSAH